LTIDRRLAAGLLLTIAFMWCTSVGAQPSPAALHTESTQLDGQDVAVDVFVPGAERPHGVAIVAHGFARNRSRHRALGEALAAAGLVAVIPDLPHVVDHWSNGDALAQLSRKLEEGALGLPPTARSRLVLIGTSAGGFASVLAAARLPGLAGWIGLDPVDRTGFAIHAASQLTSPAVLLLADPSACNLFGSGRSIARAAPRLLRTTTLRGASHCDFEEPTNKFCKVMCGASSPSMQARARQETVRAAVEMVQASTEAIPAHDDPAFPALGGPDEAEDEER
jgi:pimeloyl-ACP methyl ester carboxylesterase